MGIFNDLIDGVAEAAGHGLKVAEFLNLLRMDRETALRHVQLKVETKTPQQLDEYENDMLNFYSALLVPKQSVRAMELYAWLKIAESVRYNQFRGFVRDGDPVM